MSKFVLDNSVAMRWFVSCNKEENQAYSKKIIQSFADPTVEALVPNLWDLEAVSALLGYERREELTVGQVENYLVQLKELPIYTDPLTAHNAFSRTLALARAFNLSSYDASYLELAIRESLPIATLDKKLKKASMQSNVKIYLE